MIQEKNNLSKTLKQLGFDLDNAYDSLNQAIDVKHNASITLDALSQEYRISKNSLVANGVPGKNTQERTAYIEISLEDTGAECDDWDNALKTASLDVRVCELEVERLRTQLRILETLVKVMI